jgi:hypothetical protein
VVWQVQRDNSSVACICRTAFDLKGLIASRVASRIRQAGFPGLYCTMRAPVLMLHWLRRAVEE